MKPKQLIILGVVLVALIFLYSFSGNVENTGSKSGLQAGDVIINSETLNVNDVTSLKISDTDDSVHLSRQEGSWVVSNRDNYKADFSKISRVLKKLIEIRVAEQLKAGASTYSRFDLSDPKEGSDSEGAGTRVQLFKSNNESASVELIVGKRFGGATVDSGQQGGGNGKYLRLGGNENQVFIVADSLYDIESSTSSWLEKNPFSIDKPKNILVTHSDEEKFNFTRTEEGGDAVLEGLSDEEELNTSNTSSIVSPFASFTFKDVVVGDNAKPENTGLAKPVNVEVSTFDGFNYKIAIGKGEGANVDSEEQEAALTSATYYLKYSVDATFPEFKLKAREAQDDEVIKDDASDEDKKKISELVKSRDLEDKEKQQKDYEEKKKIWKDKLDKEKSFSGTIYEIDSWNAEKFFNKREDLVKKKEKEEAKGEVDPGSVLNLPNEGGALPAIPGTLIPGITPQNDDSGE